MPTLDLSDTLLLAGAACVVIGIAILFGPSALLIMVGLGLVFLAWCKS